MLKRREFLKHSAIVATAASTGILGSHAGAASPLRDLHNRIHFVLVDEELAESIAFANTLIAHGARPFSVQADIGRLWFGELGKEFKHGHAIAGLTSHSELLVSTAFARQVGARVRFEGSHDCRGCDVLTHSLKLGADNRPLSQSIAAAESSWPETVAAHLPTLTRCDSLREEQCRTTTARSATHPGSLFSWLIA